MGEVVVGVVADELKASVACGMLSSEGIACYSRPGTELGFLGTIGSAAAGAWRPQEIVVNAEDAEQALKLLKAHCD